MTEAEIRHLSDDELYRQHSIAAPGTVAHGQLAGEIVRRQGLTSRSRNRSANLLSIASIVIALAVFFQQFRAHKKTPSVLDVKQVIIRNSEGRIVAWLGSGAIGTEDLKGIGINDVPLATTASGRVEGLFLFSNGKAVASFIPVKDGAVLDIKGERDSVNHLTGDGVELFGRNGHAAGDFKSWPSPFVDVHDPSGQVAWSSPNSSR